MIYIFLALIFYTGVVIVSTFAARLMNSVFVAAIVNLVSTVLPVILAVPILTKSGVGNQRLGIFAAIVAGIFVALFSLFLNKSFAENKVGIVTPIVYGGTILLSTVISYFVFKEKVSFTEGVGLSVLTVGFVIIIYARFTGN